MIKMEIQQYFDERLNGQIEWYDSKSKLNKSWHHRLKTFEIIAAALIPLLAGFNEFVPSFELFVAFLGTLIAIAAAASSHYKFHENWIQYRTTAEQLKHEKYTFMTNTAPYDSELKFSFLVYRVERLISKENSLWASSTIGDKSAIDED